MGKLLRDSTTNLAAGLRLALFRSCAINRLIINADQLVCLLLIDLALNMTLGYFLALPEPVFNSYALPYYSLEQSSFFLLVYLVLRLWKRVDSFLVMTVMTMSLSPILNLLVFADNYWQLSAESASVYYQGFAVFIACYAFVLLWRVFYIASGRLKILTTTVFLTVVIIGALQYYYFGETQKFWYPAEQEDEDEDTRWEAYRAMDAEKLLYSQPELLGSALQALNPQRQGISDLFFVGFAGYATEDVFSKEVVFAKGVLDSRFDTQGHSINLVNHLSTRETQPLANATNLGITLKRIGVLMNKEEDVLVMYLTSHGSRDHQLSVSFWPLALNNITPEKLRALLDESGIKWRVIIVSACYSGGFVKALESNETLVATAAAADKTSFGCGSESEFTYFGEALFKDQLPHQYSIITALQDARVAIEQRERREKIEASMPQISIGKSIQTKLEGLSEEVRLRECTAKANSASC